MPFWNTRLNQYNGGQQQKDEIEVTDRPSIYHFPVIENNVFIEWEENLERVPTKLLVSNIIEGLPLAIQITFSSHITLAKHYVDKDIPDFQKVYDIIDSVNSESIPEEFNRLDELKNIIESREL
jgi:hypothetical protein